MAALHDRIAIVGTAGSGKTYTAKGFVERLLDAGARVTIIDPLGVWWGLRAGAGGNAGYPVVVFGGRHADVSITADMEAPLGRLIAGQALTSVIDLSELGSNTARRQFMTAFAEAIYEASEEPLHLVQRGKQGERRATIRGSSAVLVQLEAWMRTGSMRI
jgi:DNA helicase HerA-like ATPase